MKKVLICGLGAVGLTYAVQFKDKCDLKILVDNERYVRYKKQPPIFNGEEYFFEYILPQDFFDADLIIISTKSLGLDGVLKILKNFVSENTYILSLINGISSETKIQTVYPKAKVVKSYFIGHSAVRVGNSVTQDGIGEIVMDKCDEIAHFFDQVGINYLVPNDINYSMWLKFTLNVFSNQTSAILKMNFGQMKRNPKFMEFAAKIIKEVKSVAEKENVKNLDNLEKDAYSAFSKMCDDGKTSMLQDVLAKRQTEVDIFAGEIIKLGKKHGIPTPYNQVLYDLIKIEENN